MHYVQLDTLGYPQDKVCCVRYVNLLRDTLIWHRNNTSTYTFCVHNKTIYLKKGEEDKKRKEKKIAKECSLKEQTKYPFDTSCEMNRRKSNSSVETMDRDGLSRTNDSDWFEGIRVDAYISSFR